MSEGTPRRGRAGRFLLRTFLLVIVPLGVGLVALHLYARGGRYVETENAYVKAHVIDAVNELLEPMRERRKQFEGPGGDATVRDSPIPFPPIG